MDEALPMPAQAQSEPPKDDSIVNDPNELRIDAQLLGAIKDVGNTLERSYAGWGWMVEPWPGGCKIFAARCNGSYGCYLTDRSMEGASWPRKLVIMMGGELLERFRMPRKPFDKSIAEYIAAKAVSPSVKGWLIPDLQDKPSQLLMKREMKEQGRIIT